jgi:hypothetical protein
VGLLYINVLRVPHRARPARIVVRVRVLFFAQTYTRSTTMEKWQVGALVVVVILLIWVGYKVNSTRAVEGPSGGVVPANHPAAAPMPAGTPYVSASAQVTPKPPKLVKYIIFRKDTNDLSGGGTFQIGEVKTFVDGVQLKPTDYTEARYLTGGTAGGWQSQFPVGHIVDGALNTFSHTDAGAVQELLLAIDRPANVTSLEVYNRLDCCQARLNGVKIILQDDMKNIVWTGTLTGQKDPQVFKPSLQGFRTGRGFCGCWKKCTCGKGGFLPFVGSAGGPRPALTGVLATAASLKS